MKFPITRESLLAYDPVKEDAEKKEDQLQGALYQMLTQLRNDFEAAMPYMATQKELSMIKQQEKGDIPMLMTSEKALTYARAKACVEASQNFQDKRFIWNGLQQKIDAINYRPRNIITLEHIPRFVDMVKESFIGCAIIVDPLKTYIIIDWS